MYKNIRMQFFIHKTMEHKTYTYKKEKNTGQFLTETR